MPMTDAAARRQLAELARELYARRLVTASGGNLSVRSPERPDLCWITPSALFKGGLEPDDMVLVDLDGNLVEGRHRPSVEVGYHAPIMRMRPGVNAVVHTHSPLATVFGMSDLVLPPITVEAILVAAYPRVPFFLGGSAELHEFILTQLGPGTGRGAFLRNHGLVTMGATLRAAVDEAEMVEHALGMFFELRRQGIEPSLIPPPAVDLVRAWMSPHPPAEGA